MIYTFKGLGESDREEAKETNVHFGFMSDWLTSKVIHLMLRPVNKYRESRKDLHMMFIDFEKPFGKVLRNEF